MPPHLRWYQGLTPYHWWVFSVGALAFYFSMKYATMSSIGPILFAIPAVTALGAIVFLKERMKRYQYLGMVLVLAGAILIAL